MSLRCLAFKTCALFYSLSILLYASHTSKAEYHVVSCSVLLVYFEVPEELAVLFPPSITSPPWSQNACLAEFQPSVADGLSEHIVKCVQRLKSRSLLIDQLAELLGHPLESTSGKRVCACFLVACGPTQFLLFVEVGIGFPEERPSLCVQMIR